MDGGIGELISRLAGPFLLFLLIALSWRALRHLRRRSSPVPDGPPDEPYRVFTREHDLELSARDAVATLRSASPDHSKGWLQGSNTRSQKWTKRTEQLLNAQQIRFEERAAELRERLTAAAGSVSPRDFFASLLIDQSGSMKGEPIAHAAVAAALMVRLLSRFGAPTEILGFSTAGWHGGKAYQQWLQSGRPERPGRLCALRHVVYKTADEDELGSDALKALVNADLLRENIDGEAILWARDRLGSRPERHKLLVVISDGAPVDDATLLHNGLNYLPRHLMRALSDVEHDGIVLGAIGIDHRVGDYYPISETVEAVEDLPEAVFRLLEKLIARAADRASTTG